VPSGLLLLAIGFAALGAAAVVLASPTHWVLAFYFASQLWQDTYMVAGIALDGVDVSFAALAAVLAVRGRPGDGGPRRRMPRRWLWAGLAAFLVASYAVSPAGGVHMTDPLRAVYQSYRYAIRGILLFPLCYLLVTTGRRFDDVLRAIVLTACACSVMSWAQGYAGQWGTGPFTTKNGLAAALAVPVVFATVDVLCRRRPWPSVLVLLILLRGALFASSRGAFAGILGGVAVAWWLLLRARVRTRMGALGTACVLAVGLAVVAFPELLDRPTVTRFFTTFDTGQNTFVWRTEDRWPHFFRRALEQPWLGWGEAVDRSLGDRVNTPHNGYLSLAVTHGIPVLALYMLFIGLTMRDGARAAARAPHREDRIRGAKICGALACILIHNVVDAVVVLPFVAGELWLCAAFAPRLARARRAATPAVATAEAVPAPAGAVAHVSGGSRG